MRRSSSCAKMKRRTIFSLLLCLLRLSTCSAGNPRQCPSEAAIDDLLVNAHIPGAVVLVMNRSATVYEYNYGYDCLSTLRSTNANRSIFALASVSKTFIAVSVMQLVQMNLVELDRDINEYLNSPSERIFHPLYPSSKITLRQLLSHSASINRNDQMEGIFVQLGDQALTSTALRETCYRYLYPNASNWLPYPSRSVTLYSNIGAALAALVVERVTQVPYDQYVRKQILEPLNIHTDRATYRLSDLKNRDDLVRHYTFNRSRFDLLNQIFPQLDLTQVACSDWISIPFYGPSFYPANLLRISGSALATLLRMVMKNGASLLQPDSINIIKRVVPNVIAYELINSTETKASVEYGLIWNWRTIDQRRYFGHTGNMPSVANSLMINEKGNTGVIILTNGDSTLNPESSKTINDVLTKIQVTLIDCYQT